MLDITDYNFKKGSKLLIEFINNDLLEGTFCNGGKNRLDLIDITVYSSNYFTKGPLSYYRSEIKSVRVIKDKNQQNGEVTTDHENDIDDKNIILIPKRDYDDLRNMTQKYIYLGMVDVNYCNAMKYLEQCENLGIALITKLFDKFASLSLLVISSWDQVYIFDVLTYGIPSDLKYILETPHVTKIAHDARLTWGVLKNQYKIEISNIFDTMCADVTIQEKSITTPLEIRTRSIGECFSHYFHFPESFIDIYKNMKMDNWDRRPLSNTRKLQASQLGAYLVYLKNYQEQIMLRKFLETSSRFAMTFKIPVGYNSKSDGQLIRDILKKVS